MDGLTNLASRSGLVRGQPGPALPPPGIRAPQGRAAQHEHLEARAPNPSVWAVITVLANFAIMMNAVTCADNDRSLNTRQTAAFPQGRSVKQPV
jgi:hypothetical protein